MWYRWATASPALEPRVGLAVNATGWRKPASRLSHRHPPARLVAARDPFLVLGLSHDAGPEDVRQAFRRLARKTHPDRGGSATAFHEIRLAYSALTENLESERRLWNAPPSASPFAAGLDPRVYPTCPVRVGPGRNGRQATIYDASALPRGWAPPTAEPPGGTCVARYAATETAPAFGVWTVPLDERRYRCVFGPAPAGATPAR